MGWEEISSSGGCSRRRERFAISGSRNERGGLVRGVQTRRGTRRTPAGGSRRRRARRANDLLRSHPTSKTHAHQPVLVGLGQQRAPLLRLVYERGAARPLAHVDGTPTL